MRDSVVLKTTRLSKIFGGLVAVNDLNFQVERNQIKAIIGPNGAGKTTFFNLVSGLIRPSSGMVEFDGRDITGFRSHGICRLGMARTFQNLIMFSKMTCVENVMVGFEARERFSLPGTVFRSGSFRKKEARMRQKAGDLLALVGLDHRASELAGNLPYGEQKLLEIARALATQPHLLLLDEPAAGLNTAEQGHMVELISQIRNMNITILLVEHNMKVVMGVSDEIIVLNYGEELASGIPEEIQGNKSVIKAYLGEEIHFVRD